MKYGIKQISRGFRKKTQEKIDASGVFITELIKGIEVAEDNLRDLFKQTVQTWERKPEFEIKGTWTSKITVDAGTDDKVWNKLDQGTDESYAVMIKKYIRKTRPNIILSSDGHGAKGRWMTDEEGRLDGVEPKVIEARNWTQMIYDISLLDFRKEIKNAVARGNRKLWS